MKLFQIEEPDGSPIDPDVPGVAIGIDLTGIQAEVAMAIGGNAVILPDREDFPLDLAVPTDSAPVSDWRDVLDGARLRAERALAQPVTHAVVVLAPSAESAVHIAAAASGLVLLEIIGPEAVTGAEASAVIAAIRAEDLAPRPDAPPDAKSAGGR